ncbi:hypothetical protein [Simplicispira suum]|uniref:Holin n=1 Tax=Simplicispira suum TaxID=2109915 RepID=A0A2S0N448_9BURK|nr:hypothetical protein [Simplicispira suum]AVO42721.1 hypothetical protein C6571_16745 [Simplicispira suum]
MNYILKRMREPSTWSGIAAMVGAMGLGVPAGTLEAIGQIGIGLAGLAAIFMREKADLNP